MIRPSKLRHHSSALPVSAEQDALHEASYQARLIRTLGIWLLVCVAFQIAPWVLVAYLILVIGKHVVSR
jgi:hypothetical protein